MNSRLTIRRPGRAVAAVGAVVAVSATTLMALLAGNAAAAEPGKCVQNVNVRAAPDIGSRIVGLCEAGTAVQVGETRNGFVRLLDLGGWSAQEFVSVNGAAPAAPAPAATTPAPAAPASRPAPAAATPAPSAGTAPAPRRAPAAPPASGSTAESPAAGSTPPPARTFPQRTPAPSPSPSPSPAPAPAEDPSAVGGLLP